MAFGFFRFLFRYHSTVGTYDVPSATTLRIPSTAILWKSLLNFFHLAALKKLPLDTFFLIRRSDSNKWYSIICVWNQMASFKVMSPRVSQQIVNKAHSSDKQQNIKIFIPIPLCTSETLIYLHTYWHFIPRDSRNATFDTYAFSVSPFDW